MDNSGSKFYYSRLTDRLKELYDELSRAILNFESTLRLGAQRYSSTELKRTVEGVIFDNPVFFYLESNKVKTTVSPLGMMILLDYDYTREESERLWAELNRRADEIIRQQIDPAMPTLVKQRRVHNELCKIVRATKPYCREDHSAVGALLRGKCVCDGYAYAYKLICDKLHIASIVVAGEGVDPDGKSEGHAWNITRIDGVTAHTDCSWDAPIEGTAYDYFNLSDDEISADHRFDRDLYPPCGPNSINYFSQNDMIASDEAQLHSIVKAHRNDRSFAVRLLFDLPVGQIKSLPFAAGRIRYNEAMKIIGFSTR